MSIQIFVSDMETLIKPTADLIRLADGFVFTEGPLWDPSSQSLFFSDIPADTIYRFSDLQGVEIFRKPSNFANGLAFDHDGRLIACEHRSRRISRSAGDTINVVVDRYQGKRLNSPNDVIVAKDGSILFTDPLYGLRDGLGGPSEQELSFQGVYRVAPGANEPTLLVDDFEAPNGLALSHDETILYIADTIRRHIRAFNVRDDWTLSGGDILVELKGEEEGKPDGMKLDVEGNVFSTGPGGIWICTPGGDILGRIKIPEKTSNLAWGDKDYSSLYITASTGLYKIHCLTSGSD
jgi:sugar lactone lactonase YvrE